LRPPCCDFELLAQNPNVLGDTEKLTVETENCLAKLEKLLAENPKTSRQN
jgi:hypothetical protein